MTVRRWHVLAGLAFLHGLRRGAEIGVSGGRLTTFLTLTVPKLTMVAVDRWLPDEERDIEGYESYQTWPLEESLRKFAMTVERTAPGRVRIIRAPSLDAAKLVEDGSLDFVFIDASHTYEDCKADIAAWTPKVRSGGFVSGHDYEWPTVKRAVDEGPAVQTASDNVWYRQRHEG